MRTRTRVAIGGVVGTLALVGAAAVATAAVGVIVARKVITPPRPVAASRPSLPPLPMLLPVKLALLASPVNCSYSSTIQSITKETVKDVIADGFVTKDAVCTADFAKACTDAGIS